MRRSRSLLLLFAIGACGSIGEKPGPDGGGGSSAGGTSGSAGAGGGGRGGTGGSTADGGAGGSTAGGGAGGSTAACQAVLAIDRSCTTASDCLTAMHSIHCCGPSQFIGFRSSEKTLFQTLEAQCDASLGICDCPRVPPIAEDGSWLRSNEVAAVACLQGRCTTFVADCGQPCPAGTTCFSCPGQGTLFAACTTPCTDSSMCTGSTLPLCQMGWSGNRVGQFCTAAGFQCDGR